MWWMTSHTLVQLCAVGLAWYSALWWCKWRHRSAKFQACNEKYIRWLCALLFRSHARIELERKGKREIERDRKRKKYNFIPVCLHGKWRSASIGICEIFIWRCSSRKTYCRFGMAVGSIIIISIIAEASKITCIYRQREFIFNGAFFIRDTRLNRAKNTPMKG